MCIWERSARGSSVSVHVHWTLTIVQGKLWNRGWQHNIFVIQLCATNPPLCNKITLCKSHRATQLCECTTTDYVTVTFSDQATVLPLLPFPSPSSPNFPQLLASVQAGGAWYWEKLGIFSVLGIQVKILSSKSDLPIENKLNGDCHIWRETILSVTQIRNTGDEREDGVQGVWGVCTLLRKAGQAATTQSIF